MAFVSACCVGELCRVCNDPAKHKIEEVIFPDDPFPQRHPLTAYICHTCFRILVGPAADEGR